MLRAKDQSKGALTSFKSNIIGIKTALAGITGFAAAAGFSALIKNMEEAEEATSKLDAAFKNTGKTVGLTRDRLDTLAAQIQNTTTVSDDLVKEGEAILLTFDRVRGEAFERTIRVAADLSARLGTDLKGAIRQVGLALQDPVAGLTLLRRTGVAFSDEQKALIKGFLDTNQAAKAQNLILSELERRFGGSAAAARNTLGGALSGLKNAFGDLFEGTRESTTGLVTSINALSKTLTDPQIKQGIDTLINGFTKLVEILIKGVAAIGNFQGAVIKFVTQKGPGATAVRTLLGSALPPPFNALAMLAQAGATDPQKTRGPTGAQRRSGALGGSSVDTGAPTQELKEFNVTVRKIVDLNADALREMEESTRTSTERVSAEFSKLKATLQTLLDEGLITKEEFDKRTQAGIKEVLGLEEFDLNEIRAKYITLKKETTQLGEFMKGVWQGVGNSIRATISDAIYNWRLSWRSLLDIARRALADIGAAIITSGIGEALKGLFKSSGGGGGTGGLTAAGVVKAIFGLAGGGRYDGLRMVGENGPELVAGSGHVWNQRQMAFGGMSKGITYAPVTTISIIEREDPEATKREIFATVASQQAQQQAEFVRLLGRSGVEVKG